MKLLPLLVLAVLLASCCPCSQPHPCPQPEPSASATVPAPSASAPDASAPACVEPKQRDMLFRCERNSDCYDGSPCTEDRCTEGGCIYVDDPDGHGCDAAQGWHGECRAGACCPR